MVKHLSSRSLMVLAIGVASASLASCVAAPCTRSAPLPIRSATPKYEADEGRPSTLFRFYAGRRSLSDDVAWDEIESPWVVGFDAARNEDTLGFEVGLSLAGDFTKIAGVHVGNLFLESSLGLHLAFGEGPLLPYVGVGGAMVLADVEGSSGGLSVSDDDVGFGVYGHGGILYLLGSRFFLGIDARLLTGTDVELLGIDTDADYSQITGVIGWGA